ncbi:hypothetical protein HMI54_013963, partial [Coelomomyces lativittatus]
MKTFDILQHNVCYCQTSSSYPLMFVNPYEELLYSFETLKYAFHKLYIKMNTVVTEKAPENEIELVLNFPKWQAFMQALRDYQDELRHSILLIRSVGKVEGHVVYAQLQFLKQR